MAQDIAGLSNPYFTPNQKGLSTFGEAMEIYISVVSITAAGAVIGLSGMLSLASDLPDVLGIVNSPLRGLGAMLVLIPVGTTLACAAFGGLFAFFEGWAFREGFEFIVQTVRPWQSSC